MKKHIILIVFIAWMIIAFSAGIIIDIQASEKEHIQKAKELSIGIVFSSLTKESHLVMKETFEKECAIKDINVTIVSSESNSNTQEKQIKELVRKGINILILDPIVKYGTKDKGIEFALANDVHIIFMNNVVKGYEKECSYVGFNNTFSGSEVAKKIINNVEKNTGMPVTIDSKPYAILLKETDSSSENEFEEGLKASCNDKIFLLETYTFAGKGKRQDGIDEADVEKAIDDAMNSYCKVDVIICTCDEMASLSYNVVKNKGINVLITGQDSETKACSRLNTAEQLCTVYKDYIKLVDECLDVSHNLYKGGIKEKVSIDTKLVDVNNLMEVIVNTGYHQAKDIYIYN